MSTRLYSLIALLALVAGVGVTLSARALEPESSPCNKSENTAERPNEETACAREDSQSGSNSNSASTAPARDENKPAKPAKQRPAWPPPSEFIA